MCLMWNTIIVHKEMTDFFVYSIIKGKAVPQHTHGGAGVEDV
jgi:hypothetical protein